MGAEARRDGGRHQAPADGLDPSIRLPDAERSAYRRHLVRVAAIVVLVIMLLGVRIGVGVVATKRAYANANPVDVAAARACKPFYTARSSGIPILNGPSVDNLTAVLSLDTAAERVRVAALRGPWIPLAAQIDKADEALDRSNADDSGSDLASESVALEQVTRVLEICNTVPVDAQGHVGGY